MILTSMTFFCVANPTVVEYQLTDDDEVLVLACDGEGYELSAVS